MRVQVPLSAPIKSPEISGLFLLSEIGFRIATGLLQIRLDAVAPAAEHLTVFRRRLAAFCPRDNVIARHLIKFKMLVAFGADSVLPFVSFPRLKRRRMINLIQEHSGKNRRRFHRSVQIRNLRKRQSLVYCSLKHPETNA